MFVFVIRLLAIAAAHISTCPAALIENLAERLDDLVNAVAVELVGAAVEGVHGRHRVQTHVQAGRDVAEAVIDLR